MSTVSHKDLTGADLHEPKGAASAASGTVYVANGSGGGSWTTLAALTGEVGEIKTFMTFSVPSGFLELDGSLISRTTYADLFTATTFQQTGSRTNGSATISGLPTTSGMVVGHYIGGTGIPTGTTITNVVDGTSVTMSANATSTGSATVIVSTWGLGNGTTTFTLPDTKTEKRFFRSRGFGNLVNDGQSSQNAAHNHDYFSVSTAAGNHLHTGTTTTESNSHTHNITVSTATNGQLGTSSPAAWTGTASSTTGSANQQHTHDFITSSQLDHTHSVGGTTTNQGGTEARPINLTVIYAVRY